MDSLVEVEGRTLRLTNLDKPLFPGGFTKGHLIDHLVRMAPVLLPHLRGRNLTTIRFPDGVDGEHFYAKSIPRHAPDWVKRVEVGGVTYVVCEDVPTLVWLGNLAAIELHVPLHRAADDSWDPDRIVFDLDPGPGAGIAECAAVAMDLRDLLSPLGMSLRIKTSGSKGMQLYAIPPSPLPYRGPTGTTAFAKRVAEGLEAAHPDRIVSKQAKELRPGKVLIDWSQNVAAKTTVCVYSLRARREPTVSTPVTWDEVASAVDGMPLRFTASEIVARVADLGDLFA